MKWQRLLILAAVVLVIAAVAVLWSPGRKTFATPSECLDAYREAKLNGDVDAYLSCLGEPLRSETQSRNVDAASFSEQLRRDMKDVKSWSEIAQPQPADATAIVDVEEMSAGGKRSTRFRLEQSGGGWLIVGIEGPKAVAADIPYGTHISQTPEAPARSSPR